jgi:predicted negative regulator of RcsB-dependent stress response
LQQKKYTEALATLATPVEADFEPLLLETKGDVYAAEGKNSEAVAAYEQALNKLPKRCRQPPIAAIESRPAEITQAV